MQVFLETPRLVLRRFTPADVDNLVSLNADPDVMRFLTGGIPTGRDEIENELLPAFLGYYERCDGYGFWAAIEKRTGEFLGVSTSRRKKAVHPMRLNSASGCVSQPGAKGMRPRGRAH